MCDLSSRAGCVPIFTHESEREPFVGEVEKRDEKRFGAELRRQLFDDIYGNGFGRKAELYRKVFRVAKAVRKYNKIKGRSRKRRRSRHFCPQCGQLTGVSAQSVVASFEENFRAAGVLVPANADVPRILVVPCGRFGRKSR